ncbi:ATP phosphoribosyltransferase catalytic subunit [Liberibacter crescens BT-1]|uniref:ATP phosphoribosyltransferase n=1 Tax=Liberibacter crescens (strain BT-1) TaxID=1215343 RepID=L0EWF6_LIBCB|nr:ATP phosphoribosyltransferase [Liberibacter crescens]AGA64983.1 ATP phosphoribosyltransferase catalytic subunit [Liberibacter crescens BT-1]AMC13001.1 ATP phosphoribosyltransferase catalytic subunit [Liberibacter crescens]
MTLTIALPSKGRMKENAQAIFQRAGFQIETVNSDRSYNARIDGYQDIKIIFLSSMEIARNLATGFIDFGITGEDLIREKLPNADLCVEFCARLGFGQATLVVAVPEIWLDVDTMADLVDVAEDFYFRNHRRITIATKYWNLTQKFFSENYGMQLYRIIESFGATEGAPAAGIADIIVDITSTDSTLKANNLKRLSDGIILNSEACLVRVRKTNHENDKRIHEIINAICSLV